MWKQVYKKYCFSVSVNKPSWLMWVLHLRVLRSCSTAHSRQACFSFPDLGQQEYFVLAPGRCYWRHPWPKSIPTQRYLNKLSLWFAFVLFEGKTNCSWWPTDAKTLQFSWVSSPWLNCAQAKPQSKSVMSCHSLFWHFLQWMLSLLCPTKPTKTKVILVMSKVLKSLEGIKKVLSIATWLC